MERRIIGADLALRHGALVDDKGEILYTYESPDGMNSTLESIYLRSKTIAMMLPVRCIVVIDWDRTIGSWGKGRSNSSVGTLLTLINWGFGIIARETRQADVEFVAPSKVRKALELPPQTSKKDVHKLVADILPKSLQGKFHKLIDIRGDCIDAFLLAYTRHKTKGI